MKCDNCKKINDPNNFICEYCGFDFNVQIIYNKWGLPEITHKNENYGNIKRNI